MNVQQQWRAREKKAVDGSSRQAPESSIAIKRDFIHASKDQYVKYPELIRVKQYPKLIIENEDSQKLHTSL